MIKRDRSVVAPPSLLMEPDGAGQRERSRVLEWIEKGCVPKDRPDFKAYKDRGVVVALERVFDGKCAYCESPYGRTQPVDVEHWRPKAEVVVAGSKAPIAGYPWLAMDWGNLLPSCIDCNRARTQHVLRPGKDGVLAWSPVVLGKGNQFPLFNEANRWVGPNDPRDVELPKLIDPCLDDPGRFFKFNEEGIMLPKVSQAKTEAQRQQRERALTSIDVYALNRKGLVDERRERILVMQARFALIRSLSRLEADLATNAAGAGKDRAMRQLVLSLIDGETQLLKRMCGPEQPYTLLANQFVAAFKRSMKKT